MDANTGLIVLGAALGSKEIVVKLLGPTADYVGTGLRNWTEKRVHNVARIFDNATKRLGSNIDSEGRVPPRVLKGILDDGSFCDDELTAEYFGGVLASSRSEVSRDDRAASLIALIGRLSTYQIRAHYILCTVFKRLYDGSGLGLSIADQREIVIYLPYSSYYRAMDFSDAEQQNFVPLLEHVFFGLDRERLVAFSVYGGPEVIQLHWPMASEGGILYRPSALAAELYLWAHGCPNLGAPALLDPNRQFDVETSIKIPEGYVRLPQIVIE